MGTTPIVVLGSRLFFSGDMMSIIASMSRMIPPAILKSATVTPRMMNIPFPRKANARLMTVAVMIDCQIILFRSLIDKLSTKDKKMGVTPIMSTAMNMGINDKIKGFSSSTIVYK